MEHNYKAICANDTTTNNLAECQKSDEFTKIAFIERFGSLLH